MNLSLGLAFAAIVLLAVAVGAAVPALLQLRKTLRAAELTLESSRPRLARALDEAGAAAETLNRTAAHVERGSAGLERIVESASGVADSMDEAAAKIRSTGAMVGAVVAGLAAGARAMGGGREHADKQEHAEK